MLPLSSASIGLESTTVLKPLSVRRPISNRFAASLKVSNITGEIDCLNASLYSTRGMLCQSPVIGRSCHLIYHRSNPNPSAYTHSGAEALISLITARPGRVVHRLVLGHNELGDDGCAVLFKFLESSEGRKYHIGYISLNANDIGEQGLLAIAGYLKHNQHLKQLFLQNVRLVTDNSISPGTINHHIIHLEQARWLCIDHHYFC